MKKFIKIISLILIVMLLLSCIVGCKNKKEVSTETPEDTKTEIKDENTEKDDENEIKLDIKTTHKEKFIISEEAGIGITLDVPDSYKEIVHFVSSTDNKSIKCVHQLSGIILFSIDVDFNEIENNLSNTKLPDSPYVLNLIAGEEINEKAEDADLLKQIQENSKNIFKTINVIEISEDDVSEIIKEQLDKNPSISTTPDTTTPDTTTPDNPTVPETSQPDNSEPVVTPQNPDDTTAPEEEPEYKFHPDETVTQNEDGSMTYKFPNDEGGEHEIIIYPENYQPPETEAPKVEIISK